MDVKSGYKQTGVGMIPEEWDVTTVGNEFSIQLGKMLDSKKNAGAPKPYLGNRAVQWGRIDLDGVGVVRLTSSDLQRFRLREGDLLVCEGGEIGRAAIWRQPIDECYFQKALHRLRPLRGYNVQLMLHILQRLASTSFLLTFVTQTSIAHLPKDKFETVPIPLPATKAEQVAIAEALSDADALIESLEQLIAKKRDLKQGAMQELLTGKNRLYAFGGKWEAKRLDELGRWTGGMTPSMRNPDYWRAGTVPWISSGDVKSARLTFTAFSISEYAIKQRATTLLPAKSIIVVTRSGILRKYLPVAMNMIPMAINQDIKALLPNEHVLPEYLLHSLTCNGDRILGRCLKSGTTVESIEFPWLRAFTIPVPPLPEQTAIAAVLSDMDAEIAALESKLAKARQIKQGMMQELLTGKVRLI
jgi:type I restriction enzyme S subunit